MLAVTALGGLSAPTVLGAPAPFESMRATCDGYGETRLTSPGNGAFTPGFIEGTNQVLVPHVVSYTITGGEEIMTGYAEKAGPLPPSSITCDVTFQWHVGGVLYVLTGYVVGQVVGQP